MIKAEQISMFPPLQDGEDADDIVRQVELFTDYAKKKRSWENAFQKWSDKHGIESDNTEDYGCCGYGSMCDWCTDNSYGRPCVRALNAMCREKQIKIDYTNRDFKSVWIGIYVGCVEVVYGNDIDNAPTIENEPVRRGHWLYTEAWPHRVYCSVCFRTYALKHWQVWEDGSLARAYCPNCGAKMEGE